MKLLVCGNMLFQVKLLAISHSQSQILMSDNIHIKPFTHSLLVYLFQNISNPRLSINTVKAIYSGILKIKQFTTFKNSTITYCNQQLLFYSGISCPKPSQTSSSYPSCVIQLCRACKKPKNVGCLQKDITTQERVRSYC